VQRSLQVHGALGVTNELPLARMWQGAATMGLVDGPTEVHRLTVARYLLKEGRPAEGLWPTEWIPGKQEAARAKFAEHFENVVGNL
jgi:acyl-CoA dehydrogenase